MRQEKRRSMHLPRSHPRYLSLFYRDLLAEGIKRGITSLQGLTAHGRGEAFDYLLGEKTHDFAQKAIEAVSALLLIAKYPVISVNGNTATLVPKELVELSKLIDAKLEVNLFHPSRVREKKVASYLRGFGAKEVLLPDNTEIPGLSGNRGIISRYGQKKADVIFVPLEDGDRTEYLIKMGKKVITVDLNPLSRTAKNANITIVDNIVRAMPILINTISSFKKKPKSQLKTILKNYNNKTILSKVLKHINKRLNTLASEEN